MKILSSLGLCDPEWLAWLNGRQVLDNVKAHPQDAALTTKIIEFHDDSNGTYGSPRVHAGLAEAGLRHGRKRVARSMREAGDAPAGVGSAHHRL